MNSKVLICCLGSWASRWWNHAGFFFLAAKYGGKTSGWCICNQPHVLPPYFAARKKNPGTMGTLHLCLACLGSLCCCLGCDFNTMSANVLSRNQLGMRWNCSEVYDCQINQWRLPWSEPSCLNIIWFQSGLWSQDSSCNGAWVVVSWNWIGCSV
jgi:hypothetical protein